MKVRAQRQPACLADPLHTAVGSGKEWEAAACSGWVEWSCGLGLCGCRTLRCVCSRARFPNPIASFPLLLLSSQRNSKLALLLPTGKTRKQLDEIEASNASREQFMISPPSPPPGAQESNREEGPRPAGGSRSLCASATAPHSQEPAGPFSPREPFSGRSFQTHCFDTPMLPRMPQQSTE